MNTLKHTGELPIVGVNTFQNPRVLSGDYERPEIELIRASYDEKDEQLKRLSQFKAARQESKEAALERLAQTVIAGGNIFSELMHTVRHATMGEISETLYQVGGAYRRSM